MAHLSLRLKGLGFRVRGVGPRDLDLGVQDFGVRLIQVLQGSGPEFRAIFPGCFAGFRF